MRRYAAKFMLIGVMALMCTMMPVSRPAHAQDQEITGDDIDEFTRLIVTTIEGYWRPILIRLGVRYMPPRVYFAREGTPEESDCDEEDADPEVSHAYCALDHTITLDIDSDDENSFLSILQGRNPNPMVIIWTVAHEWGHFVQYELNLDGLPNFPAAARFELQADCLAGLFMHDYNQVIEMDPDDLPSILQDIRESADANDMPQHERDHGTAAERIRAFTLGFQSGSLATCSVPSR